MLTTVFCLGLIAMPAADTGPLLRTLFESEKWYQEAQGTEGEFEGVLELVPSDGRIGMPARFSAFRLSWLDEAGKPVSRPVYTNGKDHLLAPFVSHRTKIVGKVVVVEVDGQKVLELWPARMEVHGEMPFGVIGELKMLAQTPQPFLNLIRRGHEPQPIVIRDGHQLAQYMGLQGVPNGHQMASAQAARQLGLRGTIDWNKQMIIAVYGGLQRTPSCVEITKVTRSDTGIDVHWKLTNANVGANNYPQTTIVIQRFDGEIRFRQEGAAKPIVFPALNRPDEEKPEEPMRRPAP
jgi:hypothetical protein